jgi:hypothetical protein
VEWRIKNAPELGWQLARDPSLGFLVIWSKKKGAVEVRASSTAYIFSMAD